MTETHTPQDIPQESQTQQAPSLQPKTRAELDLNALASLPGKLTLPPATIGGEPRVVYIEPPDMSDLLALANVSQGMDKDQILESGESFESFERLRQEMERIIPELKGVPDENGVIRRPKMNPNQIFGTLEFIVNMAMPEDLEELKKQGKTFSFDEKKIPSDGFVSSPGSATSSQDTLSKVVSS